jgi:hypothetical protein
MARTDVREGTAPAARQLVGEIVEAGLLAGAIGAIALAIVVGIATAVAGDGFFEFPRYVAVTFVGLEAADGGAGAAALGLAVHLAVGALWGLGLASFLGREVRPGYAALVGLAYGLAVLLFMTFAVLPSVNAYLRNRITSVTWPWFLAHLAFGLGCSLAPWFRRRHEAPLPEGPYPPVKDQ